MAGGMAVLGLIMGSSASKNLDNAHSNLSEAKKFREEMETASVLCIGTCQAIRTHSQRE